MLFNRISTNIYANAVKRRVSGYDSFTENPDDEKGNDKTAEHGLGAAHRDTLRSRLACEDWRGILVSLADIYGI